MPACSSVLDWSMPIISNCSGLYLSRNVIGTPKIPLQYLSDKDSCVFPFSGDMPSITSRREQFRASFWCRFVRRQSASALLCSALLCSALSDYIFGILFVNIFLHFFFTFWKRYRSIFIFNKPVRFYWHVFSFSVVVSVDDFKLVRAVFVKEGNWHAGNSVTVSFLQTSAYIFAACWWEAVQFLILQTTNRYWIPFLLTLLLQWFQTVLNCTCQGRWLALQRFRYSIFCMKILLYILFPWTYPRPLSRASEYSFPTIRNCSGLKQLKNVIGTPSTPRWYLCCRFPVLLLSIKIFFCIFLLISFSIFSLYPAACSWSSFLNSVFAAGIIKKLFSPLSSPVRVISHSLAEKFLNSSSVTSYDSQ